MKRGGRGLGEGEVLAFIQVMEGTQEVQERMQM